MKTMNGMVGLTTNQFVYGGGHEIVKEKVAFILKMDMNEVYN